MIDWICEFEGRVEGESDFFILFSSRHGKLLSDLSDVSEGLEKFD